MSKALNSAWPAPIGSDAHSSLCVFKEMKMISLLCAGDQSDPMAFDWQGVSFGLLSATKEDDAVL